ncbi:GTP-binding protein [Prochlorococcus marinus]|uniref:GTP-binding protein n=1 Tax=Prochlorococcus marinus TaxID=1219 RepID=UPI0022B3758F|nr:GTP-binding protein [Prochlorococcus marinus]
MKAKQTTAKKCSFLLNQWKKSLSLTAFEKSQLSVELKALDRQINRLSQQHLRVTVFGRVGVGKSSLLNALFGEEKFSTDIGHGSTRKMKGVIWEQGIDNLQYVELVDTPGIDEITSAERARLASRVALHSDLILLVIDSDINSIELDAMQTLINSNKPILLILNRCDQWTPTEVDQIVHSIRNRLPSTAKHLLIETVAAAPRSAKLQANGKVRSEKSSPKVTSLKRTLLNLLSEQGNLLLTLNAVQQADNFYHSLKLGRLKRRKLEAQGLIGKFAAFKASGVAVNPLLVFDFATGIALDTALVMQLSKLYDLELKGHSARELLKKLSLHNFLLGGAQIGIQILLGSIKHLLLSAAPFTGGLSLAPAAPVALAQAAVAVHTTKLTGKLAAKELLQASHLPGANPNQILRCLARSNPKVKDYLNSWQIIAQKKAAHIHTLLP